MCAFVYKKVMDRAQYDFFPHFAVPFLKFKCERVRACAHTSPCVCICVNYGWGAVRVSFPLPHLIVKYEYVRVCVCVCMGVRMCVYFVYMCYGYMRHHCACFQLPHLFILKFECERVYCVRVRVLRVFVSVWHLNYV